MPGTDAPAGIRNRRAVAGHLPAQPCTRPAAAQDGAVRLHCRSLPAWEAQVFPPGGLTVEVRLGKEGKGDPIRRTLVLAADGHERQVREGPAQEEQDALAARLRAALWPGVTLAESGPAA